MLLIILLSDTSGQCPTHYLGAFSESTQHNVYVFYGPQASIWMNEPDQIEIFY